MRLALPPVADPAAGAVAGAFAGVVDPDALVETRIVHKHINGFKQDTIFAPQ